MAKHSQHTNHILHIGVDFNIGKMSGVVSIVDKNIVYTVDEFTKCANTEDLINAIKQRYGSRQCMIYPDSSGKSEHTNASQTDIYQLCQAFGGDNVKYYSQNPRVKLRVGSVNAMYRNAAGNRRAFVNVLKCPQLTKGLEQQGYKHGEPDKTGGLDHCLDAFGYFIWYQFPMIGKPTARVAA